MELENNYLIALILLEFEYQLEQRERCGECKIYKINTNVEINVYSENIGEPPHFHLICDKNYESDNYCLRIDINKQYPHGKHKKLLSSKQLKQLNKILKENNYKIWKKIIQVWNKNNPNNTVKIDLEFNDYTEIIDKVNKK